jgi:broad specificity phosphatase PhoE
MSRQSELHKPMRQFVFARHAESSMNAAQILSSDPSRPIGLSPRGRRQALRLGEQIRNLDIELAVHTRLQRTRETVELALRGRDIPIVIEAGLDDVRLGALDGAPIRAYWAWKENHARSEPFPMGESLDDAARRYAEALRRLVDRPGDVTLVVSHQIAIRYLLEAASGIRALDESGMRIPNAVPYLFDEQALRNAIECLDVLAPPKLELAEVGSR